MAAMATAAPTMGMSHSAGMGVSAEILRAHRCAGCVVGEGEVWMLGGLGRQKCEGWS